ncbi:MAG: Type II/IV secretion system ATP hydrolase TadA/VirB11/CpaF, TadA subfamily [uncultured Acidimicrobiales bacterium]|uniref:Type II/IV secretion system ATP hydrolase TadA/VirB11/CpaF, TadA subfamily n=1 Tax=uncultured Acidimicrobiales bacterium TaxID=310071 RepID=A0A6J4IXA0_9ACTN|nr:MAG: Type II/IV secretion system ATP hydrolase TadA/VirB11/CpaF, TadA subfamily [uncultured Acidimicrobiales bacterium]
MKLNQRLKQVGVVPATEPVPPERSPLKPPAPPKNGTAGDGRPPGDPLAAIKLRAQESLFARLGGRLFRPDMTEEQLHRLVIEELGSVLQADRAPLSPAERQRLLDDISEDVLGYGPLEAFLADPEVSEIMVTGTRPIYVERAGRLYATSSRFVFEDHLRRVIERIVGQVGRRIDESSPMVDARLADGSRVNAVLPPLALDGPTLTIRKFSKVPLTVADLIRLKTLTPGLAELASLCVMGRLNILVTGGTGTGKTTLLNVLSASIPENERIVTIEDSAELQLVQDHLVRLEGRPPNIESRGEVTIRDLVRNSLRMRPDRIIVGEVRGGEALDMLQAMNTGHEGSMSTLHANTPRDAVSRLETMVLMAGIELPSRAIREQIASAINLIVHLSRLRDGTRRVTHLTEVTGMESGVITLQDIFTLDHTGDIGEDGLIHASLVPTGIRPAFAEKLKGEGLPIPARLLGPADPVRALRSR